MGPGKRPFKISILEPETEVINGAQVTNTAEKCEKWAGYVVKGGRLFAALQKINSEITTAFEMSYTPVIDEIGPGWKIEHNSREYDIIFVDDTKKRENSIVIACKAVE